MKNILKPIALATTLGAAAVCNTHTANATWYVVLSDCITIEQSASEVITRMEALSGQKYPTNLIPHTPEQFFTFINVIGERTEDHPHVDDVTSTSEFSKLDAGKIRIYRVRGRANNFALVTDTAFCQKLQKEIETVK